MYVHWWYYHEKFGPGKKWTGGPIVSMKKVDPLYEKLSGHSLKHP